MNVGTTTPELQPREVKFTRGRNGKHRRTPAPSKTLMAPAELDMKGFTNGKCTGRSAQASRKGM